MSMNWKLRLQNKTTLLSLIGLILTLIYKVLDIFGVAPAVPQTEIISVVELLVGILCMVGIVVDPTTAGIGDSARAMTYDEPHKD